MSDVKSSTKGASAAPTTTTKKPGKKDTLSKAQVSESESESESESATSSSGSSESGSESGSEDSGSEESSDGKEESTPAQPSAAQKPPPSKQATTASFLPTPPYEPPHGFQAVQTSPHSSSRASRLFTTSNLAGKQLWHISAPASVPITAIKEVALDAVQQGEAVVHHKGADYGFVCEESATKMPTKVLAPSQTGDGYKPVQAEIAQTLHMQQIVHLPILARHNAEPAEGSSHVPSASSMRPQKPARPQPKGLKMRYLPTGFGNEKPGTTGADASSSDVSDEEDNDDTSATFKTPKGLMTAPRGEKRKHDQENGINGSQPEISQKPHNDEGRPKKSKHNHKHDHKPSDSVVASPTSPKARKEGQSQKNHPPQDNEDRGRTTERDGQGRRKETSQERAKRKRKEKRRAEKEA
ncbi:MAG: hypothetical protein M1819_003041 [Sarea resinae]|nr:MAG: hypothetical protein M1819_003041 [Sarea resinae]